MATTIKNHGNPYHDNRGRFTFSANAAAQTGAVGQHDKPRKRDVQQLKVMSQQEVDSHAEHAMGQFRDELARGLTPAESAGLAANSEAESGGDPARHQGGGGPGCGLFQLGGTHPETDKRIAFKRQMHVEVDHATASQQRDFRDYELKNKEKEAAKHIQAATTAAGKARAITIYYLRPAHSHHVADDRARIAEKIMINFKNKK